VTSFTLSRILVLAHKNQTSCFFLKIFSFGYWPLIAWAPRVWAARNTHWRRVVQFFHNQDLYICIIFLACYPKEKKNK